jgi:DNA-directed RNA polymerase subunit F
MNILSKKPLTMAEAKELAKAQEDTPIHNYFKTFSKLGKADSIKLFEDIKALNNPKMKDEEIVKVVDTLPEDAEDVNKIFIDASLTEDEIKAVLDLVSKYNK